MIRKLFWLLLFISALLLLIVPASADTQKKWFDLVTSIDGSGNAVTTSVFGYIFDSNGKEVLIVCDPATGNETGQAYLSGVKIGERTLKKISGYDTKRIESFSQVKEITPVSLRLMAPNIYRALSYSDTSWDQYNKTGQLFETALGPVSWPGETKGYLVPGSDPDYWLIVAECYNPNNWPVKASISVELDRWRNSFGYGGGGPSITVDKEVTLGANETKYVLINRGNQGYQMLAQKQSWDGYLETWAEGFFDAGVTENLDPELPDWLKANRGYISYSYYGGPPVPNDLSNYIPTGFYVDCCDSVNSKNWSFEGSVRLTQDGWVLSPNADSKNPTVAKEKVTQFFAGRTFDQIPNVDNDDRSVVIDNIRFNCCESDQNVSISSGPYANQYDVAGPSLAAYSASSVDLNAGDGQCEMLPLDGSRIPMLEYYPIFTEFYRFVPDEAGGDVGRLVKEVAPGYAVEASSISRPYFSVSDTYKGYTVSSGHEGSGRNRTYYYDIIITHHVKIQAINNCNDVGVTFPNVNLALSNVIDSVNALDYKLEDRLDAKVSIMEPSYGRYSTPTFGSFGTVILNPGEKKTVYDADVQTVIRVNEKAIDYDYYNNDNNYINDYYVYIDRSDIDAAMNYVSGYYNWSGEPAFISEYGDIQFSPNTNSNTKFLSLNTGQIRYKAHDGDMTYRDVSVLKESDRTKWLQPMSYFKYGQAMRASDNLWAELLGSRKTSCGYYDSYYWPYMELDWGDSRWNIEQWPY